MENWSDLCDDILVLIMGKLSTIEDIVYFGAVCRRWRSFSVENRHLSNKSIVVPWVMLPDRDYVNDRHGFYSLSAQKVYYLKNVPDTGSRGCWSSQGWLITLDRDWEFQLLNPISGVLIRLPPNSTLSENEFIHVEKVVLSSTPSPSVKITTPSPCEEEDEDDEKCLVIAITRKHMKLSFLRLGDEVWRTIDFPIWFDAVTYFNDQFYAVDGEMRLYICDISSLEPKMILFAERPETVDDIFEYDEYQCIIHKVGWDVFLAESLGELFLLVQRSSYDLSNIFQVDVYKLNFDNRKWEEVKSLEKRAVFVADDTAFAIFSPNQHPGCELNCIYVPFCKFCGDVYRMETRKLEFVDLDPQVEELFSGCNTPLWFCPSL